MRRALEGRWRPRAWPIRKILETRGEGARAPETRGSGLGGRPSRELDPRHYLKSPSELPDRSMSNVNPLTRMSMRLSSPQFPECYRILNAERRARSRTPSPRVSRARAPSPRVSRIFRMGLPPKPASFHSITSPPPEHDAADRQQKGSRRLDRRWNELTWLV